MKETTNSSPKPFIALKPLSWKPSLLIFIITAAGLYSAYYLFATNFTQATGQPFLIGYLIAWVGAMSLVFCAAVLAYRLEGRPFTKEAITSRFRLDRLSWQDVLWLLALFVVSIGGITALSFTMHILASFPLFAPHPTFPPDLGPDIAQNLTPGVLFGMPLQGKWWIAGVYLIGWLLNILGEEFWYRGWMLPRQELAFGKYAWLVNGLMFNFQHTFQPWNLLAMLPGSLFLSYVVQHRGKTWLSIIWHGTLNIALLVFVVQGVAR